MTFADTQNIEYIKKNSKKEKNKKDSITSCLFFSTISVDGFTVRNGEENIWLTIFW